MEVIAKQFWLPKDGCTEKEYEDAFHAANDVFRYAVADGATEASFSGIWAKQLVRAFCRSKLSVPIVTSELKPLQGTWQKIVNRTPLTWYAEEKARSGAFAAFVGLELFERPSDVGVMKRWKATAAGDSCLVHVSGDKVVDSFPIALSEEFGSRPNLLCSLAAADGDLNELVVNQQGTFDCDDSFLLMTDAIACWFFKEYEKENKPWSILKGLNGDDRPGFEEFVTRLRRDKLMKNDDVTLLRIDIKK